MTRLGDDGDPLELKDEVKAWLLERLCQLQDSDFEIEAARARERYAARAYARELRAQREAACADGIYSKLLCTEESCEAMR